MYKKKNKIKYMKNKSYNNNDFIKISLFYLFIYYLKKCLLPLFYYC